MKRALALGIVLAVVASACAEPAPLPERPTTSTVVTVASTATSTSTSVPERAVGVPCSSTPPVTFALLCDAFRLLEGNYMDPIDPAALAAAAWLGIQSRQVVDQPEPDVFVCAFPSEEFEDLCGLIAAEARRSPLSTLVEAAVQGMFTYGLDPFSAYIPAEVADDIGEFGPGWIISLGLVVGGRDEAGGICRSIGSGDCRLVVLAVFPYSAAEKAGIVEGDVIAAVNREDVVGRSLEAITGMLSAAPGIPVEIVVDRPGGLVDKTLTHEDLRFGPGEFEMVTPRIAYLRLNEFSQLSAQLTGEVLALDEFKSARGLVLDLRDNPGGLVYAAMAVASQFLDGGVVLREVGRDETSSLEVIAGGLATGDSPKMAVLVNGGTASSSEVVAAVLQERGRATVIGTPTFGKNLVQLPFTARNGGEFLISIARWTTPAGADIGINGVQPDIIIESAFDGSDPALKRAIALLGG